jgi:uncharacterized damage-inducible protein DinB
MRPALTVKLADVDGDLRQVLVETYAVSERMNQIVLELLDPTAWRAKPPNSRGRTIAAVFSHVHNIRRKWLRLSAPHIKLPAPLDRTRCTQRQARAALAESGARCAEMVADALSRRRVEVFHRDRWAKPWPAGAAMVAYMICHDAHHRGQVCMLAHQLGFPLPAKAAYEMWGWERLGRVTAGAGRRSDRR